MPHKDMYKICDHINFFKHPRCGNNPLKYYLLHRKAPPVVHFVCPLQDLQSLPPCKRPPDQLPHQWKMFNYPNLNLVSKITNILSIIPSTR